MGPPGGLFRLVSLVATLLILIVVTTTQASQAEVEARVATSPAEPDALSSASSTAEDETKLNDSTSVVSNTAAEGTAEVLDEREKDEEVFYGPPTASNTTLAPISDAAADAEEEVAASAAEDKRMTMDESSLLESSWVWVSDDPEGELPRIAPTDWIIKDTRRSGGIDWSAIDYDQAMTGVSGDRVPDYLSGMTMSSEISPYTNISLIPLEELRGLIGGELINTSLSHQARIIYDQMNDMAYFDSTGETTLESIRSGDSSTSRSGQGVVTVAKREGATWCTCTRCFWSRQQQINCHWYVFRRLTYYG